MEKGTLIEFRVQGEHRLAVADHPEGKKDWIVIDSEGQSHKIRPQRVEYTVNGSLYQPSDIPSFIDNVESYLDPDSLEVAWEILIEDHEAVTPQELSELLFSEKEPASCYAAHSLLSRDKIYFKKKGDGYEPRSANQVAEIKHQLEVQNQKEQEKEQFIVHLQQAIKGESVNWSDSERIRLETIAKIVLYPDQNHRTAQEVLASVNKSADPQKVFYLLVQIGWWSEHENLFLLRSSYPIHFPQKVLNVSQSRLTSPVNDSNSDRLDLTHLKVYTIDDESTEEIDDGLSVEYLGEEKTCRLWIHIADPTRLVTPGDELDLEARRRSTSLYLPTGMISMFPTELATGPMSLVQGQVCSALSFGVTLDESGAILDYVIRPSIIKPTYRLTYHDVDEMLELGLTNEPEIADLAKSAKKRREWRKSQGSIQIQMPESSIKVKENEEITIELLEGSFSRQLVAEMMILTGEVAGKYAKEHNLPLPFRGQPQPELPPEEELLLLPAGPVRYCAVRRCMPRSEMGTTPMRHASLGLDSYIQVTSPIRRYTDLLAHFQLKAHLRGHDLPFSLDALQEILYSVGTSAYEATLVERQTNRYWGLEYLRRNADIIWQALVLRWLREEDSLGIILLEDLGLELPHRFNRAVNLGDRLEMKVSLVDPHRDEIRFQEAISANL
ncbi:putative enzyme [Hyella patelloides LEGE 07179]|uniref:Putative enzyme n=1 Tax=Hyella patelloides LEGE 07179 TaxID=945734 RepID=A0A563VZA0_9CYAN|nr:ribonuclease R family protein [Hyella patelloides]VEP16593.1 putative enzyme [Hyella patelloides LEGE 07179]